MPISQVSRYIARKNKQTLSLSRIGLTGNLGTERDRLCFSLYLSKLFLEDEGGLID